MERPSALSRFPVSLSNAAADPPGSTMIATAPEPGIATTGMRAFQPGRSSISARPSDTEITLSGISTASVFMSRSRRNSLPCGCAFCTSAIPRHSLKSPFRSTALAGIVRFESAIISCNIGTSTSCSAISFGSLAPGFTCAKNLYTASRLCWLKLCTASN